MRNAIGAAAYAEAVVGGWLLDLVNYHRAQSPHPSVLGGIRIESTHAEKDASKEGSSGYASRSTFCNRFPRRAPPPATASGHGLALFTTLVNILLNPFHLFRCSQHWWWSVSGRWLVVVDGRQKHPNLVPQQAVVVVVVVVAPRGAIPASKSFPRFKPPPLQIPKRFSRCKPPPHFRSTFQPPSLPILVTSTHHKNCVFVSSLLARTFQDGSRRPRRPRR